MKETTVSLAPAGVAAEAVLPARVQEALGELVGAAREGLLALSVGVGLGVLAELMEEEVVEVVGAKGRQDPDRTAVRHGHEAGEVTLGGRRVAVERPRVRSADGRSELPLATYAHFGDRDPLTAVVLERMLAGVSTRRFARTQEPVGLEVERAARSTSRSAVSRSFVERTRRSLGELMSRRLEDVRLAAMMIDGLELQGRTNVVALGITTEGVTEAGRDPAGGSRQRVPSLRLGQVLDDIMGRRREARVRQRQRWHHHRRPGGDRQADRRSRQGPQRDGRPQRERPVMPKSMQKVLYVAVATKSGEVLCEPTSYASAAIVAQYEEGDRLKEIADVNIGSGTAWARALLASVVADAKCNVRFHSSTPFASPEALAALEGPFRYSSGWEGWYDPSAGRYLNRSDVYEPVDFDPSR